MANAQAAAHMLDAFSVEHVLHCGDIGSRSVVQTFSRWPAHYVFGNTDDDRETLREEIANSGGVCHGDVADIKIADKRIAMTHGHDPALLTRLIRSKEYALVCSGHTHQFQTRTEGETLVLNPGALFRARKHTVAIVNLETMQHEIVEV